MTQLAGRYTLDVPLGDSDLGTVWNAHDENDTPLVAVTLEPDADPALHERFRAHAKALLGLHHPSIVRGVAEGQSEDGSPYLVMERLHGESLATRLEAGPALTVARIVEIGTALADALAEVHAAGVAHGDIEPGNVLLVEHGGKEIPKLIGFALNRAPLRRELAERMSAPSLGPAAYAAPEQARGEVTDSALADQASLGSLVYAALGGRPPHIARDAAALAHAIGQDKAPQLTMSRRDLAPFASTLDRALASDPSKRFADIAAFGRALKTAGTLARTVASTPVPLGERSAIGEPPAPALPRAATIPKPGAKVPMPGKLGTVPRPGAAHAAPATLGSRTTQELDVADLQPATAKAVPPSARSTEELDVRDLIIAAPKPHAPPHKLADSPAKTATPHPAPVSPEPATKAKPAAPPHAASEPEPSEAEAAHEGGGGETELPAELAMADAPAAVSASDLVSDPGPPPPPAPPDDAKPTEAIELMSDPGPPPVPAAAKAEPARTQGSTDADVVELVSDPGPPPSPPEPAEAKAHGAKAHEGESKHAPPPVPKGEHAAPPKPPSKPKPPADEPPVAFSPSMETIVAAANAKAEEPVDDEVPRTDRKPWVAPVAIAALVLLGLLSWVGYRALAAPVAPPEPAGRTLTIRTTPPDPTVAPPITDVIAPPPTSAIALPPPTTTAVTPPATRLPPTTGVTPPATRLPPSTTTRPPPTTGVRPPTTGTRPPPTTGARPPTTGTRPPPTTGTRPPPTTGTVRGPRTPPPTTTTRPTVVVDPGF